MIPVFIVCKATLATLAAVLAEIAYRRSRRPEVTYLIWLTVLFVLVVPAILPVTLPLATSPAISDTGIASWLSRLFPGFLLVWMIGSACVLARYVYLRHKLDRWLKHAVPAPDSESRCERLGAELALSRTPRVVLVDGVFSPFLWHPFRGHPCVVIPSRLWNALCPSALDAVILHELVHLRRRDAWRGVLRSVIVSLWWWLPTAWIARRRLRELEEIQTDDEVLRLGTLNRRDYASALLDAVDWLSETREFELAPTFLRRMSLSSRLKLIVTGATPQNGSRSRWIVPGLCALCLLAAACGFERPVPIQQLAIHDDATTPTPKTIVDTTKTKFPDAQSVTVHRSAAEITLEWSDDPSEPRRIVKLLRVSEEGTEPQVWQIDLCASGLDQRGVDWVFTFLNLNNDLVDTAGTRYLHPARLAISRLRQEEDMRCDDFSAA